jgi:TonB family protein
MNTRLILLVALVLAWQTGFCQFVSGDEPGAKPFNEMEAQRLEKEGLKALNEDKIELAIQQFEAALRVDPGLQSAKSHLALARQVLSARGSAAGSGKSWDELMTAGNLAQATDFAEARKLYESALRMAEETGYEDHRAFTSLLKLAQIFQSQKAFGLAEEAATRGYNMAEQLKDADELATFSSVLSELHKQQGRLQQSKTLARQARTPEQNIAKTYSRSLKTSIAASWKPPSVKRVREAVVEFAVDSSGRVSQIALLKSSGHPKVDQAAVEAVRKSAPFCPIAGPGPKFVRMRYSFSSPESKRPPSPMS